jgi:hypothetical protein
MSGGPDLADWLRWVGLGCELTGLGITAAGIADLRRRYSNQPGIVGATKANVHRARVLVVGAAATCARAFVTAWRWLRRTARTLRYWLLNLLRRLLGRPQVKRGRATAAVALTAAAVGVAPGAVVVTTPPSVTQRLDALEGHARAIEQSVDDLRDDVDSRIRDLASGGLRAEAVGVAILAVGLILSSVSAGLAELIRGLLDR